MCISRQRAFPYTRSVQNTLREFSICVTTLDYTVHIQIPPAAPTMFLTAIYFSDSGSSPGSLLSFGCHVSLSSLICSPFLCIPRHGHLPRGTGQLSYSTSLSRSLSVWYQKVHFWQEHCVSDAVLFSAHHTRKVLRSVSLCLIPFNNRRIITFHPVDVTSLHQACLCGWASRWFPVWLQWTWGAVF